MIRRIALKFGRAPGSTPEAFSPTSVTVFVGPNNSGKSKVLREIHQYCSSGKMDGGDVILETLEFESLSAEEANERVQRITLPRQAGETLNPDHLIVGKRGVRNQVSREKLLHALQHANDNARIFCPWYLSFNTLLLDGASRIKLIKEQPAGDLQHEARSSFQVLFRDNARRAEVSRIIHDAFSLYFTVDPTKLGHLRLRLSSRAPKSEQEERGIHDDAIQFHANALPIESVSDGVKAFAGIITEIIAGDPHVLLIDEPEAFLHPALAFNLGKEIALAGLRSRKKVFVSTHSPNFVMGCIQSGAPINIVRLTYRNSVPTARLLPNAEILKLMRNPLLRSTGVMGGIFYEFVVVTESDTDRAFYQEVNERLLRSGPQKGIPNCLFLNAQNKQTVRTIIRPLRELGIPAAAIVDVDVLKEGGQVWGDFLSAGFIPELERASLATLRANVMQKIEETNKDMKRDGGAELLKGQDREAINNLFDKLEQYGLFAVRKGELEAWLKHLNVPGKGPNWLISMFERMGEDPESQDFIGPADGDVWEFLARIRSWFADATRRGIPA